MSTPAGLPGDAQAEGRPGDFDFLIGAWRIRNRQLVSSDPEVWDTFEGEATCRSILDGMTSVEELRIPARDFSGMGLRVFNMEKRVWTDYWINAKRGVLALGVEGGFRDGVGVFVETSMEGKQEVRTRGVWDRITATTCRWEQATSRDGGASWQTNWSMHWTRVA